MNEPHGSRSIDFDYDDLDTLFSPEPVCVTDTVQEISSKVSDLTKTVNTTNDIPSSSSSTSNFGLNEDQLKKEEMILYLDLVVTEFDNKKTVDNIKAEYIKLKNGFDALRKSLSKKDEKISQLSAENVTLKKNICSLYKTAKSEMEQKDTLLQEANKKIDKMLTWCERKGIPFKEFEDHFQSKEGNDYHNYRERNYEASEAENQAFSRPSTSFNHPELNSELIRVNSKHRFSYHKSEKHKHLPSPSYRKSEKHKHSPSPDNEKCNSYNYAERRNSFKKPKNYQNHERNPKKQKCDS